MSEECTVIDKRGGKLKNYGSFLPPDIVGSDEAKRQAYCKCTMRDKDMRYFTYAELDRHLKLTKDQKKQLQAANGGCYQICGLPHGDKKCQLPYNHDDIDERATPHDFQVPLGKRLDTVQTQSKAFAKLNCAESFPLSTALYDERASEDRMKELLENTTLEQRTKLVSLLTQAWKDKDGDWIETGLHIFFGAYPNMMNLFK